MRRAIAAALSLGLILGFIGGRGVAATSRPAPDPEPTWLPVQVQTEAPHDAGGDPVDDAAAAASGAPSGDASPSPATPVPTSGRTPAPRSQATGGLASWYCLPGRSACTVGYPSSGSYGAAGPALRVGAWRGSWVTIGTGGRSIRIQLIDFCACPGGRAVDLYAGVFARLAPLSAGVIRVEVLR